MRTLTLTFLTLVLLVSSSADAQLFGKKKSNDERRAKITDMRANVLTQLYDERPGTKTEIQEAAGYAVFSNVGVNVVLFSAGGGSGVAHNNATGEDIFMRMGSAGIGIGLGVKDFRAVFVFHDADAFRYFVEEGWDFSGQADAAAQIDDVGGEIGEAGNIRKKVSVYQFTKNGLALQATLQGTKYWKHKKLNKK